MNPWHEERHYRLKLAQGRVPFGVSYLDDALGGLSPVDLIVLGAATGVGKTEIAAILAREIVRAGKRVVFYALEAAKYEICSRMKYQLLAEYFFAHRASFPASIHLNYHDWYQGKYDVPLADLDGMVSSALKDTMAGLRVITPTTSEFTAQDVTQLTREWTAAGAVILDHLHYLHWGEATENLALRNACAELRDFVNTEEVPVIALSHLRKTDRRDQSVIPTTEELHGTSEISKRANAVICFARARNVTTVSGNEAVVRGGATFVRVNKARNGAEACTQYAGLLDFDLSTHAYSEKYFPFEVDRWATEATAVPIEKFKYWMRNGKEFCG